MIGALNSSTQQDKRYVEVALAALQRRLVKALMAEHLHKKQSRQADRARSSPAAASREAVEEVCAPCLQVILTMCACADLLAVGSSVSKNPSTAVRFGVAQVTPEWCNPSLPRHLKGCSCVYKLCDPSSEVCGTPQYLSQLCKSTSRVVPKHLLHHRWHQSRMRLSMLRSQRQPTLLPRPCHRC